MKIIKTPSYRDLFEEDKPAINELIGDIPSDIILQVLSFFNAELLLGKNKKQSQIKLYKLATRRFSPEQKREIFQKFLPFIRSEGEDVTLFSIPINMNFIQYELSNYRKVPLEDTSPEQEYRFFKAYLCFVENFNDKHIDILKPKSPKKPSENPVRAFLA